MPEKIRYKVDSSNRLAYGASGRKSKAARFRTVADGKFTVDKNNQLSYSAALPAQGGKKEITLAGKWAMDKSHNLLYRLDASGKDGASGTLKLKSEIISVDAYSMAFALAAKDARGNLSLYTLTLTGKWHADENNCLAFKVEQKAGARGGTLTLSGSWSVGKNHGLIYKVKKKGLKATQALAFNGRWDISEKNRLTYSLAKGSASGFEFDAQFARYDGPKKALVYKVAVGAAARTKTLTLSGEWKLSPKGGLIFAMKYKESRVESIVFGAKCTLYGATQCGVKLKNALGKNIGVELELSRQIFDSAGSVFLKSAASSTGEFEIAAGAGLRF